MKYDPEQAISVLKRTPQVLRTLLSGLSSEWTHKNEGGDSWSPYDVVGHLVHGERTDWMPRLERVLSCDGVKTFDPYDRFAQFKMSKGKTLDELLDEFELVRKDNLETLQAKNLNETDLARRAIHPSLGPVTLSEMLSAWVVHDLGHIVQVSRVMAKQYKDEIGPWTKFLTVVNHTPSE